MKSRLAWNFFAAGLKLLLAVEMRAMLPGWKLDQLAQDGPLRTRPE